MSEIKIAFFDIDGTLLRFGKPDLTPNTREALLKLKQNGVKICIATGRSIINIPDFKGIDFDLIMSFNGSLCMDGNKVIVNEQIPPEEVKRIIKNAADMNRPVAVATRSRIVANGDDAALEEYFELAHLQVVVSEEFNRAVEEEVYQFMMACTGDEWDRILEGTENVKIAAWWSCAVDIIPKGSGKGNAVNKILKHFGFTKEEAIAFGDGGNDIDMLEAVGTGVVMGNANDNVKAVADEICRDVDDDGIYHYLKEKGMIL